MEKLIKMFEDIMVAVTFAEAGEYDEAIRLSGAETTKELKEPATAPARG